MQKGLFGMFCLLYPCSGYAMDDEKGYIFLFFSSKRDFIDDHTLYDHDQNSFSFRNEFISFNRTIHPLRQNRVQEHLL